MVEVTVAETISFFPEIEGEVALESYIKGSFPSIKDATGNIMKILNRETHLLYWTAFEQYVKKMAIVLFEVLLDNVFMNRKSTTRIQ